MSRTMREEGTPRSHEWGYKLGSVYIRKVHFRDVGMIRQIEAKVVNRLLQVSIFTSTAERQAAIEFAKAAATRPRIIGKACKPSLPTKKWRWPCSKSWRPRRSLKDRAS